MQSKEKNKKQLCTFMNKCYKFKQNNCPFLHDLCKNGTSCTFGLKCKYYHPELESQVEINPAKKKPTKINAPCRFGPKCNKIETCPFNHDTIQENPKANDNQFCKFGLNCKKNAIGQCKLKHIKKEIDFNRQCRDGQNCKRFVQGTCKFIHQGKPNNSNQNPSTSLHQNANPNINQNIDIKKQVNISNNPHPNKAIEKQQIVRQEGQKKIRQSLLSNIDYNQQYKLFERNKLCFNFASGSCQNYNCQRDHQLTIDNSIKRMFYRVMPQQQINKNQTSPLSQMFQINGKVVFGICFQNTLGFYQFEGENQILKPVQSKQLRFNAKITGLFISKQKQVVLLITTQLKGVIYKYMPLLGTIQQINIPPHVEVSQITTFLEDSIVLVGSTNERLIIKCKDQSKEAQLLKKIQSSMVGEKTSKIVKKFTILEENFFITTSQNGNINFINKNFEVKTINFPDLAPYKVMSLHACAIKDRPLLFVAIQQQREKKNFVMEVNLLNLNKQIAMTCQNLLVSHISTACDKFFLSIHNIGTLIYNMPDLKRLKGRIPFNRKHVCLDADDHGNLLLISESFSPLNRSCQTISIYKIRL